MHKIFLSLLAIQLHGAVTVSRVETTPTQAVLHYRAPSASACTIEAWDMDLPIEILSTSGNGTTLTVNTKLAHGLSASDSVWLEGTGVAQWDGAQTIATITDHDTFTITHATSGSGSSGRVGRFVNDVNTALFSGSNLDSRAGSTTNGLLRQFVLGQRRVAQVSGTVRNVSRALQNNARHIYRITCGGDTATGTFQTPTLPLGFLAVDRPVPAFAGGSEWPTLDKAGRWEKSGGVMYDPVIDPITGALYNQLYPPEIATDTNFVVSTTNTPTPVGTNWTNPGNVRTQDATNATYAAATQDPLIVRPYKVFTSTNGSTELGNNKAAWLLSNYSLESVTVTVRGAGATGASEANRQIEISLSVNGGVSPATDWQTLTLPETTLGDVSFPSGTPKGGFGDWHSANQRRLNLIDVVTRRMFVDGSGTIIDLRPQSNSSWLSNFPPDDWVSGSKIRIGGTTDDACSAGTEYDIASVQSPRQLTLQSSAGTVSNQWACAANFAVMLRKKSTSTDTITIDYVTFSIRITNQVAGHDSGSPKLFGEKPVTDGNGNQGYLSMNIGVGGTNQTIHWVSKDNGESRFIMGFLTNLPGAAGTDGWSSGICSAAEATFIADDPASFVCLLTGNRGGPVMIKYKINWDGSSAWTSQTPSGTPFTTCTTTSPPSPNPCLSAENLTTGYTLPDLIADQNPAFDYSKYSNCGIRGTQGSAASIGCQRSTQDTVSWIIAYDFTRPIASYDGVTQTLNPVKGAVPTTHEAFQGFATLHTQWNLPGTSRYFGVNPKFGRKNLAGASNQNGEGPWGMRIVSSAAINNTTDMYTCPTNNWAYPNCSDIHVTSHPFDPDPGAGETGAAAEYGEAKAGYGVMFFKCDSGAAAYTHETWAQETLTTTGCASYANLEYGRILSVAGTAPDITLVVARGAHPSFAAKSHVSGYSLYMYPLTDRHDGLADVSAIWDADTAPTGSTSTIKFAYAPMAHGSFTGRSFVGSLSETGFGTVAFVDPTPSVIEQVPTVNLNIPSTWPQFAGKSGIRFANDIQNYNANQHSDFPAARESAYRFHVDSRPWMGMALTSISYYWEKVSGATYLYRYKNMADLTYVWPSTKHLPMLIYAGPRLLTEYSGPTAVLSDDGTDHWKFCISERAGECYASSLAGEIYTSLPYAYGMGISDIRCYVGAYTWNEADICAMPLDPVLGPNIQYYYGASDSMGRGRHIRKLGWGMVRHKFVNKVPKIFPNGEWLGPLWTNYPDMHRAAGAYIMRAAPVPPEDGLDRTNFVPINVSLGSVPPGTAIAQVEFGYNDFGTPAQMYCTARQESCLATTATLLPQAVITSYWTTSNTNSTWQFVNSTTSATTPIRVTTTSPHKFSSDVRVRANSNTNLLNPKMWEISIVDASNFDLVGSTSGDVNAGSTSRVFVHKQEAPFAFSGESFSVAGATNINPIEISTTTMHRFQTGSRVCISGVGGNTAANGCHTVTATGPSTFTLDGVAGNGSYTSGGTVTPGGVACSSNCTVAVPGVTGRVLYYRWRYLNSSGTVISTGNTNTTVVP